MFHSEQNIRFLSAQGSGEEEEAVDSPLLSSSKKSKLWKGSNLSSQSGSSQAAFVSYGNTSFESAALDYYNSQEESSSALKKRPKEARSKGLPLTEESDLAPLFTSNQLFSNSLQKPNPLFIPEEAQASNPLFYDESLDEISPSSPRHPVIKLLSATPSLSKENSRENPLYSPPETPKDSPSSSISSFDRYQLRSLTGPGFDLNPSSLAASMAVSDIGWQETEGRQSSRRSSKQQGIDTMQSVEGDYQGNPIFGGDSLSGPAGGLPLNRMSSASKYELSRQPSTETIEPIAKEQGLSRSHSRVSQSGPLPRSVSGLNVDLISHSQELEVPRKSKSRRSSRGDPYSGMPLATQRQGSGEVWREESEAISEKAAEATLVDMEGLKNLVTALPKEDWGYVFGAEKSEDATVINIEPVAASTYEDNVASSQEFAAPPRKRSSLSGPIPSLRGGRDSAYSSQNVTPSAAAQRGVTGLSRAGSQAGDETEKRPRTSVNSRRVSDAQGEESGLERTSSRSKYLRSHPVDRGLAALNDDIETGSMGRNRLGPSTPGEIAMVSLSSVGAYSQDKVHLARKTSDSGSESQPASPSGDHPMRGADAAFEPLVPLKPLKPLKIIPNQVIMPVKLKPAPVQPRKQKRFWEKSAFRWTVALGVIVLVIVVIAVLA